MENARVRLEYDLNKQEFKYTKAKEEYENEYQSTLVDCSLELSNLISSKSNGTKLVPVLTKFNTSSFKTSKFG